MDVEKEGYSTNESFTLIAKDLLESNQLILQKVKELEDRLKYIEDNFIKLKRWGGWD